MRQLNLFDDFAMRWNGGRALYRPAREPIDPARFSVERIHEQKAREFVIAHHYSRSFPAAIACYGLMEQVEPGRSRLSGVAVFSVSMQPKAADAYGASGEAFCELGRFVLLDEVAGNGETYFLARAIRQLGVDKTGEDGRGKYKLCLAYSDPVPRTDAKGNVTLTGHIGGIYASASAAYCGRSSSRTLWLAPDGTSLSQRALSKLRNDDTGARYAYETLIGHGAPPITPGETGRQYVRRALSDGPFRRMHHPGNHAYILPCGTHSDRARIRKLVDRRLPRPTAIDAVRA
ncbi:MAG: hypothetical protein DI537_17425 [Stutzerimonas stutzeri]|nr:MAG: hypothetical protein DI537_17425 [Stutzerimonas stutzeri]